MIPCSRPFRWYRMVVLSADRTVYIKSPRAATELSANVGKHREVMAQRRLTTYLSGREWPDSCLTDYWRSSNGDKSVTESPMIR